MNHYMQINTMINNIIIRLYCIEVVAVRIVLLMHVHISMKNKLKKLNSFSTIKF